MSQTLVKHILVLVQDFVVCRAQKNIHNNNSELQFRVLHTASSKNKSKCLE